MAQTSARQQQHLTWDDYCQWPEGERWEIIGGVAHNMSPAPTTRHQHVLGNLFVALKTHFHGKKCNPYVAPVDVKFSNEDIVQPDAIVVCDVNQVKRTHIEGAPTLVIE